MTVLTKKAVDIFAPTDAAGQPRSPINGDAQVWGTELERSIDGAAIGRKDFKQWTGLDNSPGDYEGQPGIVWGPDSGTHTEAVSGNTVPNEGQYRWNASAGEWSRMAGLPNDLIRADNTGAGTADAIEATTIPSSYDESPYQALISVNFVAANTGAMTVALNGEAPRDLVSNTGDPIPAGYVQAGMAALVQIDSDGHYRLFSYGDAQAILAEAEAARDDAIAARDAAQTSEAAAEAAESGAESARDAAVAAAEASGDVAFYDTFSDANADVGSLPEGQVVEVFADETKGDHRTRYRVEGGELVYKIDLDTTEGGGIVFVHDFGAVGDGVTDDTEAVREAVSFGRSQFSLGFDLVFGADKKYRITDTIDIRDAIAPVILRGAREWLTEIQADFPGGSHNWFKHSQALDNSYWTKNGTTITPDAGGDPDGGTTLDKLVEDTSTGEHTIFASLGIVTGHQYVASAYVMAAERTTGRIRLANSTVWGAQPMASFDLSAGTISLDASGTNSSAGIEDAGDGLFRIWVSSEATETGGSNCVIFLEDESGNVNYTGDGTSGILAGWMQMEIERIEPTPYYRTEDRVAPLRAIFDFSFSSDANRVNGHSGYGLRIRGQGDKTDPIGVRVERSQVNTFEGLRFDGLANVGIYGTTANNMLGREVKIRACGYHPVAKEVPASTEATTTASSTTVTVNVNTFDASDVGRTIFIRGAGSLNPGNLFVSTISSVTSATEIEVSDAADKSVSGAIISFEGARASISASNNVLTLNEDVLDGLDVGRDVFLPGAHQDTRDGYDSSPSLLASRVERVDAANQCDLADNAAVTLSNERFAFSPAFYLGDNPSPGSEGNQNSDCFFYGLDIPRAQGACMVLSNASSVFMFGGHMEGETRANFGRSFWNILGADIKNVQYHGDLLWGAAYDDAHVKLIGSRGLFVLSGDNYGSFTNQGLVDYSDCAGQFRLAVGNLYDNNEDARTAELFKRGTNALPVATGPIASRYVNEAATISASQVGSTFRSLDQNSISIPDDTAISFTPPLEWGIIHLASTRANIWGAFAFITSDHPQGPVINVIGKDSFVETANGSNLSGTSGSDNAFTIAAGTDGKLYLENRRGATTVLSWHLAG